MIYEYAVDPALCVDWQDLRYLVLSCGREQGRLISDVPRKRWTRLASEAINESNPKPVERKRLKEFLKKLSKKALYLRKFTVKSNSNWIDNAIATHQVWPFKAILTTENYPGDEDFIIKNNISMSDHERWKQSPSVTVNRNAADMVDPITPLLENARQVMLIDKNFRLVNSSGHKIIKYKNVLLETLNKINNKAYGPSIKKLVYHVGNKLSQEELKHHCALHLKNDMPEGMTLQFVIWPWDELHDRFVLTDIGGVDFGQGLDEWTGSGPKKVKIGRISDEDYKTWWSKCNKKSPNFSIEGESN
jgi:hypothetical protein